MAKSKRLTDMPEARSAMADLLDVPGTEPLDTRPRYHFHIDGIYGHPERIVQAPDEEAAWREYMRLNGLLGSAHRPQIKRVEGVPQ